VKQIASGIDFYREAPFFKIYLHVVCAFLEIAANPFSFFLSFKDSLTAVYLDLGLCAGLVPVSGVVQLTITVVCAG
jgi:hypothetical protein